MDFKRFVERTCQLVVADSEFDFGFLLHWQLFAQEIDENLWGFACVGAADDIEGNSRRFEGEEFLEMGDLAECLEVGDLGLDRVDRGIDLIELFEFEEGITDWTFVQNVEDHVYFC